VTDRDIEEAQLRQDEAHRAIGRYMVEFSMLVRDMREGIELALNRRNPEGVDPMIARLALGEAFAAQIANIYFAICEQVTELDDEEKQVAIRLRTKVHDAIKDRNDFAHGDWHLGPIPGSEEPSFERTKPGRKAGAWMKVVRPVHEIDAMAEEVVDLDGDVVEFGWLCLGMHPLARNKGMAVRVRDIFRFRKHRVLREGRYADTPWFEDDDG
jgi:hypothetical protein